MTGQNGKPLQEGNSKPLSPLLHPDCYTAIAMLGLLSMPLIPGAWIAALPLILVYSAWMASQRARLPFRLPMSWKGRDYGSPLPGRTNRFRQGEGLLFLGNDASTNEELWISNSDARRHALMLATTGAGKALPNDTLILTPAGWRSNGSLRQGDQVLHPSGERINVLSVHPQGRLSVVRMEFADGRAVECSRDHLWQVSFSGSNPESMFNPCSAPRLQTSADIGVIIELGNLTGNGRIRTYVRLPRAMPGTRSAPMLSEDQARCAASNGLDQLGFMPSLSGTPEQRFKWLGKLLRERRRLTGLTIHGSWCEVMALSEPDGFLFRQLIWSLGGSAYQLVQDVALRVRFSLPKQERLGCGIPECDASLIEFGLEVIGVSSPQNGASSDNRALNGADAKDSGIEQAMGAIAKPMTCIKTDAHDGMFITENYLPTHNTEFLLGIASQSLMWTSGFMFIDGKGTTEFHAKAWSIVSKFGRQDDYRVLNFTDPGGSIMQSGRLDVQTNTINPFSHGTADQLMNLIVSLMGEAGSSGEMWRHRAMALVTSTMKALCEMRDAGDILLDVQAIRDFLPLGYGIDKKFCGKKRIRSVAEIPDAAWDEMKSRGGLIELYLRSLRGEFSEKSLQALKGFFDSLPGFSLERAFNGEPQEGKAAEQHGFLSMQLTKPLGSLADDFGHIFRTPLGEVDLDDVVLNRRILIVLLPALQKAPEEMRNCGRIVVATLKIMMGKAAGSQLEGTKYQIVDSKPTTGPSPFIAILDEAGYYMVKGIDTMMAQARSLGFMIVIAGQDMASMQSVSPQIAETVAANARLTIAGATEDAHRTWEFLQRKFAQHKVAVVSGKISKSGFLNTKWVDRPDRQFISQDRVPIGELQKLREGEFYFLMESKLVKARGFYLGEQWTPWIGINKFLAIRGPTDKSLKGGCTPDQEHIEATQTIGEVLLHPEKLTDGLRCYRRDPLDALNCTIQHAQNVLQKVNKEEQNAETIRDAMVLGLMFGPQHSVSN